MVELECDDRRVEAGVDRMENATAHGHAVVAFQHGRCVREKGRNGVTPRDPFTCQSRRELTRAVVEFCIGAAQFPVHNRGVVGKDTRSPFKERQRGEWLMVGRFPIAVVIVELFGHEFRVLPCGAALINKGADALFRVLREHILHHHIGCVGIGLSQSHLLLDVEGFLPRGQSHTGFGCDFLRPSERGFAQLLDWQAEVHKAHFRRAFC